ncbi:MAG TPA: SET domain-containing protein [Pseudolabrys sp.]|nr:SET domain-containing protein [Pseudolabrys sp.]
MTRKSFRVGRSFTGLGLFATRHIRKREKIVEYKGPRIGPEEAARRERRGNRYLYEINSKVTIDGTPRSNIARYANHSCNPNAETYTYGGRVFIRALRKIKPGEEITYDYGNDYLKFVIGRSRCKCTRCRRRRARKQRAARLKKKRKVR